LQEAIREICLKILLDLRDVGPVQSKYSGILTLLPNLIVLPEELSNRCSYLAIQNECMESDADEESDSAESFPLLANPELNIFLRELLLIGSKDQEDSTERVPSKTEIAAAVDYLILHKLKTDFGRAPEFFFQLQHMVRKILRRGIKNSYFWKLDFVYQLQRAIHLCIDESAFVPCDIPDVSRSFSSAIVFQSTGICGSKKINSIPISRVFGFSIRRIRSRVLDG